MGIFFRKSVRVGPFRFNLSGAGVGVSVGIPGLRIGTGPRGNYISAGRGGIYYRAALPSSRTRSYLRPPGQPSPLSLDSAAPTPTFDPTLGEFQSTDRGSSLMMQDVSSQDLLNELNQKVERWRLTPWAILLAIAALVVAVSLTLPPAAIGAVVIISIPLLIAAAVRDLVKKTSVLLFDLDQHMSSAYSEFNSSFEQAALANRIWHVQSQAAVFDRKYHSGASYSSQHRTYSTNESVGAAAQKQHSSPLHQTRRSVLCSSFRIELLPAISMVTG